MVLQEEGTSGMSQKMAGRLKNGPCYCSPPAFFDIKSGREKLLADFFPLAMPDTIILVRYGTEVIYYVCNECPR